MRKSDEQQERHYFRMGDRFFRVDDHWFYTTREGDEGPFRSREEAQTHLSRYLAMQELAEKQSAKKRIDQKKVFDRKKMRLESDEEAGNRAIDTTIWDRQVDSI